MKQELFKKYTYKEKVLATGGRSKNGPIIDTNNLYNFKKNFGLIVFSGASRKYLSRK